ncbi:hypothetical protein [Thalassotalea castellviae]|uniref:ASCH domain-containing protein n=1 Tax=Thalassotalea castellviae TaxID=3075612 RepID=A0ABU3A134_9GAMM|nr:hypothetical protein [Thalassotalea sp. W431]MDT0603485.1 hypothetical protein [Thalassotalea sp. W431]
MIEVSIDDFKAGKNLKDGDFVRVVHKRDKDNKAAVFEEKHFHVLNVAIRKITIGSFRRRLTLNEKVAIKQSADPVVQVLNEDLLASSYVDLDFQPFIDGLSYLTAQGLLTAERVVELLADGSPDEQV